MRELPNGRQSPRIINGVILFAQGDTFSLDLFLNLKDQDGDPVTIQSTDTVKIEFLNCRKETVKEFSFTGATNNTVTLTFDADCTKLFSRGEYTYDVYYTGENRTTLANDNVCVVE